MNLTESPLVALSANSSHGSFSRVQKKKGHVQASWRTTMFAPEAAAASIMTEICRLRHERVFK
jgi:hypothetical protein